MTDQDIVLGFLAGETLLSLAFGIIGNEKEWDELAPLYEIAHHRIVKVIRERLRLAMNVGV